MVEVAARERMARVDYRSDAPPRSDREAQSA
jgi:hypothetical protein